MRNGFAENVTNLKHNKPSTVPHFSGVEIARAQEDVYLALKTMRLCAPRLFLLVCKAPGFLIFSRCQKFCALSDPSMR